MSIPCNVLLTGRDMMCKKNLFLPMSEEISGELPQIKQDTYHPSEGTPPELLARSVGIPETKLSEPAVQEFVSVFSRLDHLIADTLHAQEQPNQGTRLAGERELFNAPEMKLRLKDRYYVANALLLATKEFLTEGMGDPPHSPDPYAFRKLNEALRRLGYDVQLTKRLPTVYNFDHDDPALGDESA